MVIIDLESIRRRHEERKKCLSLPVGNDSLGCVDDSGPYCGKHGYMPDAIEDVEMLLAEVDFWRAPRKKPRQTKFTVTIYCGNCRTVGDYEFKKGTILHEYSDYPMSERRDDCPAEKESRITLNKRFGGNLIACRFCRCTTALTIRQREPK